MKKVESTVLQFLERNVPGNMEKLENLMPQQQEQYTEYTTSRLPRVL